MLRTFGDSLGFRRVLVALLTVIVVLAVAIDSADARRRRHKRSSGYNPPYAGIVVDANSGKVLYSDHADAKRHPASLTKIMTLYLLFEQLDAGKLTLDSSLEVSRHASRQSPTKLGLKPGQTIKVKDALLGLVTRSANDAAVVIAEAIGGDEADFARLMTRKARALGMKNTVYKNASGLPNSEQVTTAVDQARLGRAIQDRFPQYYRYFSRRSFTYRGQTIRNHNRLLGTLRGVDGIKTGFIRASGFNLVASMKRDDRYLVAVVFGGKSGASRNAHMRSLLTKYVKVASTRRTAPLVAEMPVSDREPRLAAAVSSHVVTPAKPFSPADAEKRASRRGTATTASVAVATPRHRKGRIGPTAVKTIRVRLGDATSMKRLLSLSTVPTPAAAPAGAQGRIRVASAGTGQLPVAVAKAVVSTTVVPTPSPAPADERPTTRKHTGWIIQVGAFASERDAKDRLRSARSKATRLLRTADAFTETVVKNDKTFYRARFAGFEKREALAACRYLKRNDFACMTLKN